MNEELQNQLTQMLADLATNAAAAKDFALSEMPDVVSQLLWWRGIASFLFWILFLALIAAGVKLWWAFSRSEGEWPDSREMAAVLGGFVCLAVGMIGFLISFDWLQILIAPKVYLIEYAAELVR